MEMGCTLKSARFGADNRFVVIGDLTWQKNQRDLVELRFVLKTRVEHAET